MHGGGLSQVGYSYDAILLLSRAKNYVLHAWGVNSDWDKPAQANAGFANRDRETPL